MPRELYVDMRVNLKFKMIIIKVFKWFVLIYTKDKTYILMDTSTLSAYEKHKPAIYKWRQL
jgi:hypothetical protein